MAIVDEIINPRAKEIDPNEGRSRRLLDGAEGMARRGQVGQTVQLIWPGGTTSLTPGPAQTVIDLHGDDDVPEQVTVHFFLAQMPPGFSPNASNGVRIVARVTWGIGGFAQTIDMDVCQGTSFSLVASALSVSMFLILNVGEVTSQAPVTAGAFVGYGTAPESNPPQRTLDIPAIAGGGNSGPLVIPNWTRALRPEIVPITGSAIRMRITDNSANALAENVGERMLLPGDGRFVTIFNDSAVAITRGRIICELGL